MLRLLLALALGLPGPALVVVLAGPNYDEPTPPIGWWAVIVVSEIFGMSVLAVAQGA